MCTIPTLSQAASSAAGSSEADEAAADAAAEAADPERWESYSHSIFKALFRKYDRSSTKPVDPNDKDETLPARGDDDGTRGWRHHKQRGLYGAVRHWAAGSPYRVAFMLAELAKYFGVEQAVGERLGFALSAERVCDLT